ncbi:MAG: MBL fold metallo-hydrolase [Actinomycetota bacterium]|nr:MBL fold metallo-hydrolase [Actinomycetota bacterium]
MPAWATLVRADNPSPMTLEGTNTWVLVVGGQRIVVDPGPLLESHLARVAGLGPVDLVLLTHRHPDHAEGAQRFVELTGAPVLDRADFAVSGSPVTAGVDVLHTPGHTGDSVSFVVSSEDEAAALTGDTILGRGSSVVAYPDGNLADYLNSLRQLAEVGDIAVLPGHGPVLGSARVAATAYLNHRLQRLEQVREALAAGDRTSAQVVQRVYADVDPVLWPAAELSVRAQLAYLGSA